MANLEAAVAFVRARADRPTLVRLAAALGVRVSASDLEGFTTGQLLGGGWPAWWSGGQASLDATCERLGVLESLNALDGLESVRALGYVAASQAAGGRWQEPSPLVRDGPEHLRPDHQDSQALLSAQCAFWLAMGGVHRARVEQATGVLRSLESLPLRASWLTAAALYRLDESAAAEAVIGGVRSNQMLEMSSGDLAQALIVLRLAGVVVSHPVVTKLRSLLGAAQRGDGSWAVRHGALGDAITTLDAIRALRSSEPTTVPSEFVASGGTRGRPPPRPNLRALILGVRDLGLALSFWRGLLGRDPAEHDPDHLSFAFDHLRLVFRPDPTATANAELLLEIPEDDLNPMLERARTLGATVVRNRFEGAVCSAWSSMTLRACASSLSARPENIVQDGVLEISPFASPTCAGGVISPPLADDGGVGVWRPLRLETSKTGMSRSTSPPFGRGGQRRVRVGVSGFEIYSRNTVLDAKYESRVGRCS